MTINRTMRQILAMCFATITSAAMAQDKIDDMTVHYVDIERFMGPWYVQGHTPLVIDDHSSNQIESYELKDDGTIATSFTFERFGRKITLNPKGRVANKETNSHWKMQFVWPLTSDYLIVRLDADYGTTVISVPGKNLIWIMSRDAEMTDDAYKAIVDDLASDGYAVDKIRRVPQNWPDSAK
jgi:apolipoprotein D and lipocalin family protein